MSQPETARAPSPAQRVATASAVLGLPVAAWGLSGALLAGDPWPLCAFQHFTGLPCPLCGGTHAVYHLLRLDPASAFQANAAVAMMAMGLAVIGLWVAAESLTGRRALGHGLWQRSIRWGLPVSATLLGLNWVLTLVRMA